MSNQLGKGYIYSLSGAALAKNGTWDQLGGSYVSPNLQGARFTHSAEVDRVRGQDGAYCGLICDGEMLECEFTVIPEGSTIANAKVSATLPEAGESFAITGLPVIAVGDFTDAFNVSGGSKPWFYEGGGSIELSSTGKATMTLPLKRYNGIASGSKITS